MIIRIVYYNNYATYLANRYVARYRRYEVLTTVSQTPAVLGVTSRRETDGERVEAERAREKGREGAFCGRSAETPA